MRMCDVLTCVIRHVNDVCFTGLFCKRDLYFQDSLLDSIDKRDSLTLDFKTVYDRSLLQNIVTFTGLFCKRDLYFGHINICHLC